MKRLKVGLFTDSFFPMIDGVCMVVNNYAKYLSKYCNVVVIAPKYNGTFKDEKLPYKVIRANSIKVPTIDYDLATPKLDLKFLKELDKLDLDVVHIHSPFSIGKAGLKYAKKHKCVLVGTMHSQYKSDFKRTVKSETISSFLTSKLMDVYNECDLCYAVNYSTAEIYYKDYGYKTMPKVLNNATEMTYLEENDNYINDLYNLDNDTKVFLFVGRINELKNIYFLIDSLVEFNKISDLKYKMFFVGNGQDEDKFIDYVNNKKMSDYVIMCGRVLDRDILRKYYKRADLFLFPSLYDASSIVQIEAASQKLPGLFLKDSATSYTIENDVNGFISLNDPKEYAKRINEIMNNKKLYDEVSNNCYEQVYKTWDDRVLELYNDYLSFFKE